MYKTFTTKSKEHRMEQVKVKNVWSRKPIQKPTWKRILKNLCNDAREYCEATTLHGFRYINFNDANYASKLLWLTVCLMSSALSVYLMLRVWDKYRVTPTVISVESTAYPIWGLPFPAVSICNFNKVYKPRADEIAEKMKYYGMNDSEIQCFFDGIPSMIHEQFSKRDFHRGMETLARIGLGPESFMYSLMQPCDKLLNKCVWQGVEHNCSEIFKTVKTSQGYCCAFNYHVLHGEFPFDGHNRISVERKKNASEYPGVYNPLMIPGSGIDSALSVLINVESDTYRASIKKYFGAAVLVHDPLVYPEINQQAVNIQPGQEVIFNLKGSMIESEESLRSLSLEQRKCLFDDEMNLNTSSQYRYESCITECRMEYIHAQCGCVPFYYPSTMERVRFCGLLDLPCLRQHRSTLALLQAPSSGENGNYPNLPRNSAKCRRECLPQCSDKAYVISTTIAWSMLQKESRKSQIGERPFFESSNKSAMTIYFPDITCLKYRRETVMTWENLLAAFGGIFGLCIGGSFVSLVEIIYFLTLRIFRTQKIKNLEEPVTFYEREVNRPMKNQSLADTKQWNIGWNDNHFPGHFTFNKSPHNIPKTMLNFSNQETENIAFTIDVSGFKSAN